MASALDVVGDRWALLIVRELILGARRFGELAEGLPGIGTDILTARLRSLEQSEVLRRRGDGRQRRYELTERGHALRPVLAALGRWGASGLGLPASPDELSTRVGLTAVFLEPVEVPAGLAGSYEIASGGHCAYVVVRKGRADLDSSQPASRRPARATVNVTRQGLLGLLIGASPRQLVRSGDLAIDGDREAASRLIGALTGPELLADLNH